MQLMTANALFMLEQAPLLGMKNRNALAESLGEFHIGSTVTDVLYPPRAENILPIYAAYLLGLI